MVLSLLAGAGAMYAGMAIFGDGLTTAKSGAIENMPPAHSKADVQNEFKKLELAYKLIESNYYKNVNSDELLEGAIQGMIKTLKDPYSAYMDKETAGQFTQSLESSFEGIGAEVGMVNDKVTIIAPFKDSPAEKAGLKPNDQIYTVDGKSLDGLDLNKAVLKIRGKKGSVVTLGIKREGVHEVMKVKVKRDTIPIETVYSDTKKVNGKTVGVLKITSFSENTGEDFKTKLESLEKKGIDGLIIDVRGNPGGYLQAVETIVDQIIPNKKPSLQIEDRNGKKQRYFSKLKEKKSYPIIGLIDGGSASASEILAGALKEAGGYELVGEKSFGKGTVQNATDFNDGSNIKLTIAKWLTPDGNWIHKKGIEPSQEVKQPPYFYSNFLTVEKPLEFDMTGEQIKTAQKMLRGLGFEPGRTDGYFDEKTETAVTAFQKANDLRASGVIDKKTAERIEEKIISKVRDEKNDLQLQTALQLITDGN
ncbi:S41 family peptidase [Fictibacillus sp. Mic-4]|uniref:S41 family peptidase n=1 Tax=Fictibacillus TaxID=1329200 RepID=UPI000557520D|nr:S41 family peptidase [Fictibacillus gelatini]